MNNVAILEVLAAPTTHAEDVFANPALIVSLDEALNETHRAGFNSWWSGYNSDIL